MEYQRSKETHENDTSGFIGFDPKHSAVVPLPFLDKLLKCYYGTGPRDGENPGDTFVPSSPAVEIPGSKTQDEIDFRDTFIKSTLPQGYTPKGAARRKLDRVAVARSENKNRDGNLN